jgi:hypothetical protein
MLRYGVIKNAMKQLNSERERSSFFLAAVALHGTAREFLRANIF